MEQHLVLKKSKLLNKIYPTTCLRIRLILSDMDANLSVKYMA